MRRRKTTFCGTSSRKPVSDSFFKDTVLSTLGIDSPNATFPRPCDGDGVPGKRVPHSFVVSAMHSNLDGSWQPFLLSNYERLHVSKGGRFQGKCARLGGVTEAIAAAQAVLEQPVAGVAADVN